MLIQIRKFTLVDKTCRYSDMMTDLLEASYCNKKELRFSNTLFIMSASSWTSVCTYINQHGMKLMFHNTYVQNPMFDDIDPVKNHVTCLGGS